MTSVLPPRRPSWSSRTSASWSGVKPTRVVAHWQVLFSMQRGSSGGEAYAMTYGNNDDQLRAIINTAGGNAEPLDPQPFALNEWIHAAATYDGDKSDSLSQRQAGRGEFRRRQRGVEPWRRAGRFAINGNYNSLNGGLGEYAVCTLDEVVIFDEALSQEQIQGIMELGFLTWQSGPGAAKDPTPEDGGDGRPVRCDALLDGGRVRRDARCVLRQDLRGRQRRRADQRQGCPGQPGPDGRRRTIRPAAGLRPDLLLADRRSQRGPRQHDLQGRGLVASPSSPTAIRSSP